MVMLRANCIIRCVQHPKAERPLARAEFPMGNRYLRVADELDILFMDDAILALFPMHGQPSHPPGG